MREEVEDGGGPGGSNKDVEVAPALISLHPSHPLIAFAVGSEHRVFDLSDDKLCAEKREFSLDGRFIVGTDRDFKIRVSVFPNNPLDGAHEIQSFCLGHTQFVSCLAFICLVDYPQGFLVSGSGDSTVRLWEITSGSLLDTFEVGPKKAGNLELNGSEEGCSSVGDICTISNSNLVAVAFQSLQGIMLLRCDLSSQTLHFAKVVSVVGETFIPTCLACSFSAELLWMITGVSKLHGSDYNLLARVHVLSGLKKWNADSAEDDELLVLGDDEVPGTEKLLKKLQGSVPIEENVFVARKCAN